MVNASGLFSAVPLQEGWIRWVHITSNECIKPILDSGLWCKEQGMLSATAKPFSNEEDAEAFIKNAHTNPDFDPRFTLVKGRTAIIIDLPPNLSKIYDSPGQEHDVIQSKFIRATVDGEKLSVTQQNPSPKTWSTDFASSPHRPLAQKPPGSVPIPGVSSGERGIW